MARRLGRNGPREPFAHMWLVLGLGAKLCETGGRAFILYFCRAGSARRAKSMARQTQGAGCADTAASAFCLARLLVPSQRKQRSERHSGTGTV